MRPVAGDVVTDTTQERLGEQQDKLRYVHSIIYEGLCSLLFCLCLKARLFLRKQNLQPFFVLVPYVAGLFTGSVGGRELRHVRSCDHRLIVLLVQPCDWNWQLFR